MRSTQPYGIGTDMIIPLNMIIETVIFNHPSYFKAGGFCRLFLCLMRRFFLQNVCAVSEHVCHIRDGKRSAG